MAHTNLKRLTSLDCLLQAEECRHFGRLALINEHRVTLERIAETWERMAADIDRRAKQLFPRLV
jgi:hypothetical protein